MASAKMTAVWSTKAEFLQAMCLASFYV